MTEKTCDHCGLVTLAPCATEEHAADCPEMPGATFTSGPFKGLKKWHYGAIYADPPWSFMVRSDKGKGRSAEMHYDVMDLDAIKALPVADLAGPNCALFMWVIDTHLEMAFDVLNAWGFKYKTRAFCWTKTNKLIHTYPPEDQHALSDRAWFKGQGFWTRANPEDCMLAVKGAPKRLNADVRRLITSPLREHSRKPDETKERIERLVAGPYCELFSRSNREGWDVMGNDAGKFDELDPVEMDGIEGMV